MADRRFDQLHFDTYTRTSEGYIKTDSPVSRVGVFKYRRANGKIVRELRHPDDVFDPASLATLALQPVTDEHPTKTVDHEDIHEHQVGVVGENVRRDGNFIRAPLMVTHKRAIMQVEKGKREISLGYTCDMEQLPGVYEGEEYDERQKNIRYNHASLVRIGRLGKECALKLDSADAVHLDDLDPDPADKGGRNNGGNVEKITLNGKEFEVSADVAAAIKAEIDKKVADAAKPGEQKAADAEKKVDGLQAKVDSLTGELKRKNDSADIKEEEIQKRVKARMRVEQTANRVSNEIKTDGLSDIEVMKQVIAKDSPDLKLDGKSDAYIEVAFDMIATRKDSQDDAANKLGKKIGAGNKGKEHTDSKDQKTPEQIRLDSLNKTNEAWKQDLSMKK